MEIGVGKNMIHTEMKHIIKTQKGLLRIEVQRMGL